MAKSKASNSSDGKPWSKTPDRNIWDNHGYPQVSIPKSFLQEIYEALYEREVVLVSRDPKTHAIFREIRLIVPNRSVKEFEQRDRNPNSQDQPTDIETNSRNQ